MLKSELREIFLAKRKNLSEAERTEKNEQITALFFRSFELGKIKFLHCFLPIEKFGEIDTKPIFERLWRDFPQIETIVPRVNFQVGEIESSIFAPATKLVRSVWGICEPTHYKPVASEKIDVVIVPLLCFDQKGFRVGYGKGFYDKFLKTCRADCLKVGLSFFAPVEKISDSENFDVKLDFCLTPPGKISFVEK